MSGATVQATAPAASRTHASTALTSTGAPPHSATNTSTPSAASMGVSSRMNRT